jgi:hypothetical protein
MIQCDRTTALQAVHTELLQPPTKIGIIGSGCSVATEPSAEVSRYYNLTQVSSLRVISFYMRYLRDSERVERPAKCVVITV